MLNLVSMEEVEESTMVMVWAISEFVGFQSLKMNIITFWQYYLDKSN